MDSILHHTFESDMLGGTEIHVASDLERIPKAEYFIRNEKPSANFTRNESYSYSE